MTFQIYQDVTGLWRWRLKAANSEIIAHGESYYNEADCRHAVELVKSSTNAPVYKR